MKRIVLSLVFGLMVTGQSQACDLLKFLFGGCRTKDRTCSASRVVVSESVVTSPSCPNGRCPNVPTITPTGFNLSGNIGPLSAEIHLPGIRDLVSLHNAERARRSLPPLVEDPTLSQAAQAQADAQASVGRMHHASRLTGSAENVAAGQSSETEVTNAWLNSPGHRSNILNGSFTRIGVGRSGNYWAVQFGR